MPDIKDYTGKITSEHADKPKYMAMVEAVSQCFLDTNQVAAGLPDDFDLDLATDAQLDDVGLWVGISRNIPTPLTNVYFSLDTPGLGFDQGAWKGPFDPDNGITVLDNETYRSLIRAKIGANHWDGTLESSKAILDLIFNPDGHAPFFPVTATNEPFATGDGVTNTFQLKYQGQNVYEYTSVTLYRTDWQGTQKLYPTPRTNSYLWNMDLTNAYWSKGAGSASVGPIINGVQFTKFTPDTTSAVHAVARALNMPAGATVVQSCLISAAGYQRISMRVAPGGVLLGRVIFDAISGTVVQNNAGISAGISDLGNGVFRVYVSYQLGSGLTQASINFEVADNTNAITFNGDGTSGILLSGMQAEVDNLTSIISTTSSAATVTDYVAGPYGQFTMGEVPLPGASLSWTGQGTAYAKGNYAFIIDNQDMTISIGLAGDPPSAIQWALLTGGYITPKPQSVDIKYFYSPSTSGPLFGFDVSNQYIAGFDQGSWGSVYS
ncbi:DUF2612 domain-containing protein [Pseudomonas sp. NPDC089428]|uniref:DUF2612 domain-containing protein n=1 Tax=Pseudomonas sp. NPDC089428 TaxID=3364467 RepID=UPI0037F42760